MMSINVNFPSIILSTLININFVIFYSRLYFETEQDEWTSVLDLRKILLDFANNNKNILKVINSSIFQYHYQSYSINNLFPSVQEKYKYGI